MKIIDRLLVIRRAILVGLHPDCRNVIIKRQSKDGKVHTNVIFSDQEDATEFYKGDMIRFFTENSKSSKSLKHNVAVWANWVQEDWNKSHPKDPVEFFDGESNENN